MPRDYMSYTEEEMLCISKPVDPAILPRGKPDDWITDDEGRLCRWTSNFTSRTLLLICLGC